MARNESATVATARNAHGSLVNALSTVLTLTLFLLPVDAIGIIDFHRNVATPSVFLWRQNVSADWQEPLSWMPARTAPASSDVLVFNIGGSTMATNIPTQTIGQLFVSDTTAVTLQSAATNVLTIAGGDGDDLIVEQNSELNFDGANAIICNLADGATASVDGSMMFSSPATAGHRLTAA